MGIPETYQIRVHGLMRINVGVLDTGKVENHRSRLLCLHLSAQLSLSLTVLVVLFTVPRF